MFNAKGCSGVPSPCCSNKISQNLTMTLITDCGTYIIPMTLASLTSSSAVWQSQAVTFQCKQTVCTNFTATFGLICLGPGEWEIGLVSSTCGLGAMFPTAVCPKSTGEGFSATLNGRALTCCLNAVTISWAG